MGACGAIVRTQIHTPSQGSGALSQKLAVGQTDELAGQLAAGQCQAKLRAYPSGLAGGQSNAW